MRRKRTKVLSSVQNQYGAAQVERGRKRAVLVTGSVYVSEGRESGTPRPRACRPAVPGASYLFLQAHRITRKNECFKTGFRRREIRIVAPVCAQRGVGGARAQVRRAEVRVRFRP